MLTFHLMFGSGHQHASIRVRQGRHSDQVQHVRAHQNEFSNQASQGSVVRNLPCNTRDMGSIPGAGRSHVLWSNYARVPQLLSPGAAAREATAVRSAHGN